MISGVDPTTNTSNLPRVISITVRSVSFAFGLPGNVLI
jgi:hypothetical protein